MRSIITKNQNFRKFSIILPDRIEDLFGKQVNSNCGKTLWEAVMNIGLEIEKLMLKHLFHWEPPTRINEKHRFLLDPHSGNLTSQDLIEEKYYLAKIDSISIHKH
jgi:hypothetical protein